jgi:hypothetical protein
MQVSSQLTQSQPLEENAASQKQESDMQAKTVNREVVGELYRALVLLGADNDLLGTVGSWGDSLPEQDVLANLKGWNEVTLKEVTQRIEHYGMSFPRLAYNRAEATQTGLEERKAS